MHEPRSRPSVVKYFRSDAQQYHFAEVLTCCAPKYVARRFWIVGECSYYAQRVRIENLQSIVPKIVVPLHVVAKKWFPTCVHVWSQRAKQTCHQCCQFSSSGHNPSIMSHTRVQRISSFPQKSRWSGFWWNPSKSIITRMLSKGGHRAYLYKKKVPHVCGHNFATTHRGVMVFGSNSCR